MWAEPLEERGQVRAGGTGPLTAGVAKLRLVDVIWELALVKVGAASLAAPHGQVLERVLNHQPVHGHVVSVDNEAMVAPAIIMPGRREVSSALRAVVLADIYKLAAERGQTRTNGAPNAIVVVGLVLTKRIFRRVVSAPEPKIVTNNVAAPYPHHRRRRHRRGCRPVRPAHPSKDVVHEAWRRGAACVPALAIAAP